MIRRIFFLSLLALFGSLSLWLIDSSIHPPFPKLGEAPRFYSNQSQQDLRLLFVEALKSAQKSIYLTIFGLSDTSILMTLKKRIAEGIDTSVYYDSNASSRELYQLLQGAHLEGVDQGSLMHQKILILDQEKIFLGSTNLTTSSLCMHDNLVVGFVHPEMARFLKEHIPYHSGFFRAHIAGQELALWLLPDPRGHAIHELQDRIRRASRSLKVALFTLTHQGLIDELVAAQRRGVFVTCVIDTHSGHGCSAKAIRQLKEAGVNVLLSQGVQLLHHKFVVIDDRTVALGSANWTKAAFTKNSDCLLLLDPMTPEQTRFMQRLWHRIEAQGRQVR